MTQICLVIPKIARHYFLDPQGQFYVIVVWRAVCYTYSYTYCRKFSFLDSLVSYIQHLFSTETFLMDLGEDHFYNPLRMRPIVFDKPKSSVNRTSIKVNN